MFAGTVLKMGKCAAELQQLLPRKYGRNNHFATRSHYFSSLRLSLHSSKRRPRPRAHCRSQQCLHRAAAAPIPARLCNKLTDTGCSTPGRHHINQTKQRQSGGPSHKKRSVGACGLAALWQSPSQQLDRQQTWHSDVAWPPASASIRGASRRWTRMTASPSQAPSPPWRWCSARQTRAQACSSPPTGDAPACSCLSLDPAGDLLDLAVRLRFALSH